MYVYIDSVEGRDSQGYRCHLYTVGHYEPDGSWEPESDHGTREEAAARVHYLNGGQAS